MVNGDETEEKGYDREVRDVDELLHMLDYSVQWRDCRDAPAEYLGGYGRQD